MSWTLRAVAVAVRWALMQSSWRQLLEGRPEVSTPANSFKRLLEGQALQDIGLSPYDGDVFHEVPLMIGLVSALQTHEWITPLVFALVDLLTAFLLGGAAEAVILHLAAKQQRQLKAQSSADVEELRTILVDIGYSSRVSFYVQLIYLLCPYSIASCAAYTSTVFENLAVAGAFYGLARGRCSLSAVWLAFAAYHGFYPALLVVPVAIEAAAASTGSAVKRARRALLGAVAPFALTWAVLLAASAAYSGSWDFLEGSYMFLLSVPELTPTFGVFWYMFTEMFDHFRSFFLWVFQLNLVVYLVPLSLMLRDDPLLLSYELMMLIAVFRPYPSVADAAVYLALLPTWRHLFHFVRHGFVLGCAFVSCTVLAPVLWHLWLFAGSANANFYFGLTLVYSTAQILLLTDLFYAYLRTRLHLKHGMKPKIGDSDNEAVATLE